MKTEQPNLSCLKDFPNPEYFLLPTLSSQYEQICSAHLHSHLDTQAEAQTQSGVYGCLQHSLVLLCVYKHICHDQHRKATRQL